MVQNSSISSSARVLCFALLAVVLGVCVQTVRAQYCVMTGYSCNLNAACCGYAGGTIICHAATGTCRVKAGMRCYSANECVPGYTCISGYCTRSVSVPRPTVSPPLSTTPRPSGENCNKRLVDTYGEIYRWARQNYNVLQAILAYLRANYPQSSMNMASIATAGGNSLSPFSSVLQQKGVKLSDIASLDTSMYDSQTDVATSSASTLSDARLVVAGCQTELQEALRKLAKLKADNTILMRILTLVLQGEDLPYSAQGIKKSDDDDAPFPYDDVYDEEVLDNAEHSAEEAADEVLYETSEREEGDKKNFNNTADLPTVLPVKGDADDDLAGSQFVPPCFLRLRDTYRRIYNQSRQNHNFLQAILDFLRSTNPQLANAGLMSFSSQLSAKNITTAELNSLDTSLYSSQPVDQSLSLTVANVGNCEQRLQEAERRLAKLQEDYRVLLRILQVVLEGHNLPRGQGYDDDHDDDDHDIDDHDDYDNEPDRD